MKLPGIQTYTLNHVIPQGTVVDVTNSAGKRQKVSGPAKVLRFGNTIRPYNRVVLKDHESGTVFDENGVGTEVKGPQVVQIHPDGNFTAHAIISLLPHEALVVVDKDGNPTINVGTGFPKAKLEGATTPPLHQTAQVEIKPLDKIHTFKWTGSKGDTEFKTPGTLRLDKLRLQETQTWYAVEARTKDGVMMRLHLTLFLNFTDVTKLMVNDDPMGVVYNSVNAEILSVMGKTSFDEFRSKPSEIIEAAAGLSNSGNSSVETLAALGLEIEKAILRVWVPTDPMVERLMAQEASATAQQAVEDAQHKGRLKKLQNEKLELEEDRKLDLDRATQAQMSGEHAAGKVIAFAKSLKSSETYADDLPAIRHLVALTETATAATGGLTLTQESLYKA